ncbi:hypothetical protein TYRP_012298 [Tyrophagus putrescentiae]|nr:hypothetical protein TYRP_012298 [Tyrophagus putrescentiae]
MSAQSNRCTVEISNPLDHSCLLEDQCDLWVENSVCVRKRCKCDLAYQATASGACEKVFCNASQPNQQGRAVCRAHFGENVQCDGTMSARATLTSSTTGRQPAAGRWSVRWALLAPATRIAPTFACTANVRCKLGSLADASYSRYNCRKVFCSDDRQCRRLFPHTKCYYSYYGCECDDGAGYETNSSSQRCVLRHQLLGTTCQADGDCGLGAQCLHHNCTCQAAFGPKENKMDCQAIDCRTDAQCQQFGDANSVCSSNGCICRDGYFVNQTLARCAPTDDNTDRRSKYSLTAIVSLIVLCVAVIGMIAFYAVSTQKRKNQARQQQRQQQQQRRQEQQQQQQQKQQY